MARMNDGEISEYLATLRKWPKLPADFGPETETIIRRYLKDEIKICPDGTVRGTEAKSEVIREQRVDSETAQEYDGQKDSLASYHLALEFMRRG